MSFKVEVSTTVDSGEYTANSLRFPSADEAANYAEDLAMRWTAVLAWRTRRTNDPVTARWENGRVAHVEEANA